MFDAVEREAGPALTKTLSNPDVIEWITLATAVRKRAESDVAELARRGLHAFNLPAGTDISKVSKQVATLEREIRQLNRRLDQQRLDQQRLGDAADVEPGEPRP